MMTARPHPWPPSSPAEARERAASMGLTVTGLNDGTRIVKGSAEALMVFRWAEITEAVQTALAPQPKKEDE